MNEKTASKANRKRAKTNGKVKQQQQTLITSKNLCQF